MPTARPLPRSLLRVGVLAVVLLGPVAAADASLLALSEIKREEVPASDPANPQTRDGPAETVPLPDPIQRLPLPQVPSVPESIGEPGEVEEPAEGGPAEGEINAEPARPHVDPEGPPPEISYDVAALPEPVRRMRERIMEACRSGDLEMLRPLLGVAPDLTQLSLGGIEGDPVAFLKEVSGDGEGQEILAILLEVLDAGYVHLDVGKPEELYAWPYFFAVPLDRLDARQRVELFKIVTAGDYEDMKTYGAYNFYRVGISPEGEWVFFVAGD